MKYLKISACGIISASLLCSSYTYTTKITAQSFDTLYPMTPMTNCVQCLMHAWEDIRMLQDKNTCDVHASEYAYTYNAVIGHLVHVYDMLRELINSHQLLSDDTSAYCEHIIDQMMQDAQKLKAHDALLMHARLIKQLNKIVTILSSFN